MPTDRAPIATTACLVVLCFSSAVADAQTIINNGSNNTTHVTVQRGAPTVLIERPQPPRPAAPVAPRPPPSAFPYQQRELLPYMSPRCAQLFETQLTGSARRMSYSARGDVHEEFRMNCQDAVSSAQRALYEDRLKSYNARQDALQATHASAEQSKVLREQCEELARILAAKRKRIDSLTEGQREDLERADSNYRQRCKAA